MFPFAVSRHVQWQGAGVQLHPESSPEHTGSLPPVARVPDYCSSCLPGLCTILLFTAKQIFSTFIIYAVVWVKKVCACLYEVVVMNWKWIVDSSHCVNFGIDTLDKVLSRWLSISAWSRCFSCGISAISIRAGVHLGNQQVLICLGLLHWRWGWHLNILHCFDLPVCCNCLSVQVAHQAKIEKKSVLICYGILWCIKSM